MARAAHEEITLPWRETVDGAVAELGAIFRVELVGGKWQCSAKSGRCRTVIAQELSSQTEAKRRAQAHAATMPEVRAVARSRAADAKPGVKKTASHRSTRTDAKPDKNSTPASTRPSRSPPKARPPAVDVAQPPRVEAREPEIPVEPQTTPPTAQFTTLGVTYQTTDGGCLCGKTQGVCWVANAGEVVFARPLPPAVHDQVRDAVMQHYAAEKAAREAAERAENEAATQAARTEAAARARASKAAAKKAAVRKIAKAAAPAKTVAAAKGSRAAKPAKGSAPAKEAKPAKGTKATKPAKEAKPAKGRKAGHVRSSKPKPARGKRGTPKEDAPVTATKNETKPAAAKRSPEATPPAAPPGPVAWSDVEGKPRGVAGHGTFLIEPEGQGFALYFADAGGQSRHLRSGAMPELRRAAEEYAARGEPASLRDAPSREQDEALMRIFASGAAEGA